MCAASRSGLTSAVMRFNSPIASAFSSHRSRSLELLRRSVLGLLFGCSTAVALPPTLMPISMTLLPKTLVAAILAKRSGAVTRGAAQGGRGSASGLRGAAQVDRPQREQGQRHKQQHD